MFHIYSIKLLGHTKKLFIDQCFSVLNFIEKKDAL